MNNFNAVNVVKKDNKIIGCIIKLRAKKLSYSKIGEKLDIHKAAVYLLVTGKWYPKIPEVEKRILARVRELEI